MPRFAATGTSLSLQNRELQAKVQPLDNQKQVCSIMQMHQMELSRRYIERTDHIDADKVVVMRSNLRWCSSSLSADRDTRIHQPEDRSTVGIEMR